MDGLDFYSINDILAAEERVTVQFLHDTPALGHLSIQHNGSGDLIKVGTKVDMPWWCAEKLFESGHVRLECPRAYAKGVRNSLAADATSVSLEKLPYYYDVGLKLAKTTGDAELVAALRRAFAERFRLIFDKAQNWRDSDFSEYKKNLSVEELEIFEEGYKTAIEHEEWLHGKRGNLIKPSAVASTQSANRKRLRDE